MFVIHFSIQITISDIRCVLFRLSVWLCQVVSPNSLVNNIVIVYLFITVLNNSQINQIMYNIELVWILSECAVFCRQIKINLNFTVAPAPAPKYSSSDCIPQPRLIVRQRDPGPGSGNRNIDTDNNGIDDFCLNHSLSTVVIQLALIVGEGTSCHSVQVQMEI